MIGSLTGVQYREFVKKKRRKENNTEARMEERLNNSKITLGRRSPAAEKGGTEDVT